MLSQTAMMVWSHSATAVPVVLAEQIQPPQRHVAVVMVSRLKKVSKPWADENVVISVPLLLRDKPLLIPNEVAKHTNPRILNDIA
jgi:ribosomal protein L18E